LHEGAKQVYGNYNGVLPDTPENLSKIKGIGPYTQGAILSFAFHKRAAAVDGNVIRVLSRYLALKDDVSKPATIKKIWIQAEDILPTEEPWVFNEGLIELGATICTKTPKCIKCPIKASCRGFAEGIAADLPIKTKKEAQVDLFRDVAVIECDGLYLVRKCPKGEIMQDLYEFPFCEMSSESGKKAKGDWIKTKLNLKVKLSDTLEKVSHGFTKYRVKLFPSIYTCGKVVNVFDYQWVEKERLFSLPFNSGHRRILQQLKLP
jgi:A/G-specific adenine glycosylase